MWRQRGIEPIFLLLLIAPKQKNFCVTKDRVPLRGPAAKPAPALFSVSKTTRSRGNPFLRAAARQKFFPPGIPLGTKFSAETRTRRKAARTLSVLNFPVCVLSIRTCRLDRTFLTVCTRAAGGAKQWPRAMQARGRFWLWKVFSQGRWRAVRRRRTGCNRLRRPGKRPLRRPRQSRLRGRPVRRIRRPPPPGRQRARDPACRRL